MQLEYHLYIWLLLASSSITLALTVYAMLRRRGARGSAVFAINMILLTVWALSTVLGLFATDFSGKLFWENMQYFGYCYLPVTLFVAFLTFAGFDEWAKLKRIWWIAVLPTLIIVLVWTDGLHGLVRYGMHLDDSGPFPILTKRYGPVSYINAIYAYALIFIGFLLLRKTLGRNLVYRKQMLIMIIGVSAAVLSNIFYAFGLTPVEYFDITPVFFGPAGLLLAWGIFRFKMLDLVPLARATVIETINSGVMVLDLQDRVLDLNPFFAKMVGIPISKATARSVQEVCCGIPELAVSLNSGAMHTEFSVQTDGVLRDYEALLSTLNDDRGTPIGRLVAVYDITERKQALQTFVEQQSRLAASDERERMLRDLHDNLGQLLGFVNLQAQGIHQELVNNSVEAGLKRIDRLVEVTQSAHEELREYIRSARNPVFAESDFLAALRKDIFSFQVQTGVEVKMTPPEAATLEKLAPGVRLQIYYIIREAFNNVRKHARAKTVKLTFSALPGALYVAVEDDGVGFDQTFSPLGKVLKDSFGLNIMWERAAEIGARLCIRSEPGKGCRIDLQVPITEGGRCDDEAAAGR